MSESNKPDLSTDGDNLDDALGRALRAEARDSRLAFSEALHARIVEALPARSRPSDRLWRSPWSRLLWSAGVVVVAVLLLVGLVSWESTTTGPSAPLVAEDEAVFDPVKVLAGTDGAEVGLMVDQTLVRSQWAYLDHDAKIAANLLIEQLPFRLAASEQP